MQYYFYYLLFLIVIIMVLIFFNNRAMNKINDLEDTIDDLTITIERLKSSDEWMARTRQKFREEYLTYNPLNLKEM